MAHLTESMNFMLFKRCVPIKQTYMETSIIYKRNPNTITVHLLDYSSEEGNNSIPCSAALLLMYTNQPISKCLALPHYNISQHLPLGVLFPHCILLSIHSTYKLDYAWLLHAHRSSISATSVPFTCSFKTLKEGTYRVVWRVLDHCLAWHPSNIYLWNPVQKKT
jgi:hypothetical protein